MRLFALLFVSVLIVSACGDDDDSTGPIGGGSDAALSVNDFTLTNAEFEDQLDEWAKLFPAEDTAGTGEGTYSMSFVSGRASVNIQFEALIDALAEAGVEVTDEHVGRAQAETDPQLEQVKAQLEASGAEYVAPSEEFIATLVAWTAANFAIEEHVSVEPAEVTEADIKAAHAQYPESICAAHILVETEEEANEISGLLDAGEDFATLAEERSTDTGSGVEGGELGCVPMGTFVAEFEQAALAATPGEVTDPVESEFGFHLIVVSSVGVPKLKDVRDDITTQLNGLAEQEVGAASQAAFEEFLTEAIDAADIEVDARYGTWDAEVRQVVPPEGSTPETTVAVPAPDPALTPEPAPVPEEE